MKTKIDKMRAFFRENPRANQREAAEALASEGITASTIKTYSLRDVRSGRAEKIFLDKEVNDWTLDYSRFQDDVDSQDDIEEWKKDIQMKLIEQLVTANERETNSEKIRMNAKTIAQLLREVK
ncbi:hypothetical protein [Lactococcus petauri]|uniref:hypothetical protein n=1 Tax=Lactococcus petauri TaxID=1940789 RepID=UPI0018ABB467|nr:hypothetical protein [Lactococcus petauri]MDC0826910.1 hypothetical protein [Lactococcus petauri]